jgi:hypothetical protein
MNDRNDNQFDRAAWIAQAKQLLDDSARDLDGASVSRLNRARQAALQRVVRRAPRPWLLPTGLASACALLLAVAVWQPHHGSASNTANGVAGDTITADTNVDGTTDEDSPEFYQDLEFYAWLDAQGKDGDG